MRRRVALLPLGRVLVVGVMASAAAVLRAPLHAAFVPGTAPAQVAPQGADLFTALDVGQTIQRELSSGEQHNYRIDVEAGKYASVTVEPCDLHVVVALRDPEGVVIADFQKEDRNYGHERVELVAPTAGRYTLVVKPALRNVPAGRYQIRLETRTATEADRTMQEARQLRQLITRRRGEGHFEEARRLTERAVAMSGNVRGVDAMFAGGLIVTLGDLYVDQRNYPEAVLAYQRALTFFEGTLGTDHPASAAVSERLALEYWRTGQRPQAEKLIARALEVTERALGPTHPQVARCLQTLGLVRLHAGDAEQAEQVDRRALAIVEKSLGTENILYVNLLNNLGLIFLERGDLERADDLFAQSVDIDERLEGPDGYNVSVTLQNRGVIARRRKDDAKAEAYYQRVLAIRQKVVGPEHIELAPILNNLALVSRDRGDVARSLELQFQALHIWEKNSGPYDRGTLTALGNVARTYAAAGEIAKAIDYQRRVDEVVETQLALNLAIGSERQRLAFADLLSERTARTISLSFGLAMDEPEARELAALALLQRKGRVLDAMTDTLGTLRQRVADSADRSLLDRLVATTARLARVALNGPQAMTPDEHRQLITQLEAQKEKLEAEISEHNAEFRARSQAVTLPAVQAAIPDDAVLVEFAVFRPFDPRASTNTEAYGAPHYAAYVVRRRGAPGGIDLGPAAAVDEAVRALREALRDPRRADLRQLARALHERTLGPLRPLLAGATRLLISPDGDLSLIPFEALVDETGRYTIERYSISYLTSGRDLLRMQVPRAARSEPTIVADPWFGEPSIPGGEPPTRAATPTGRGVTTAPDLSTVYFAPLAGTRDEARAIQSRFPEARVLSGRQATKSALAQLDAPRLLHIATHGFFLKDPATARDAPPATAVGELRAISAKVTIENPLLRSGLALSGANLTDSSGDGGILTALEASTLNLWGTKLVTLSACDTGIGEVRTGEGVYGLRRAFFLAGAETLVMSLWPVSDFVTREMMTAYYRGLKNGLGRGEALRQVQLALLARKNRQHPFYWASFIQAGEWADLDGRR